MSDERLTYRLLTFDGQRVIAAQALVLDEPPVARVQTVAAGTQQVEQIEQGV
jgi:hypothetical protein